MNNILKVLNIFHVNNITSFIIVESLYKGIDFYILISRTKLEKLKKKHFNKRMKFVEKCLMDVKRDKSSLDDVVLAGGLY
ncbi:Heat shock cognate 70 kDa protein, partial [Mucuna pruriens]